MAVNPLTCSDAVGLVDAMHSDCSGSRLSWGNVWGNGSHTPAVHSRPCGSVGSAAGNRPRARVAVTPVGCSSCGTDATKELAEVQRGWERAIDKAFNLRDWRRASLVSQPRRTISPSSRTTLRCASGYTVDVCVRIRPA